MQSSDYRGRVGQLFEDVRPCNRLQCLPDIVSATPLSTASAPIILTGGIGSCNQTAAITMAVMAPEPEPFESSLHYPGEQGKISPAPLDSPIFARMDSSISTNPAQSLPGKGVQGRTGRTNRQSLTTSQEGGSVGNGAGLRPGSELELAPEPNPT
jgi:hypothetical protein